MDILNAPYARDFTPTKSLHFGTLVGQSARALRLIFVTFLLVAAGAEAAPLTLEQLIERARTHDYRVKEAQAQLRFYRAQYDQARWAWFPRMDSYIGVGGPTQEARNNGIGGPPTTPSGYLYDTDFGQPGVQFQAGADATLPIYTFGKLDALEEAGKQGVNAGEALAVTARDESEYQMSQAYYGYCLAKSALLVVDDLAKRLDDSEKVLKRLREEGSEQVTQMDIFKLGFYRQQAEAQRAQAENGARLALAAIRLLIAAAPDEQIEVQFVELKAPEGELRPSDQYVIDGAENRPELRAIAAGLLASEQEVKIREAMFYPDFGIVGSFRWKWTTNSTRQVSPWAYDPYNELNATIGLGMRYSWDFPVKSIMLEQARAKFEKTQHQKDLIGAGVKLEIEKAWGEADLAMKRSARQTEAEINARRWANAAYTAFDLGTGDTRELVDAFSAFAQASASRAQAFHDAQVALRALNRAVGKHVTLNTKPEAVTPPPPTNLQPK
ncbi:MAG: transporter [Archangium gephyra]|uniref:Transporter n=1 Tax=Archangium gephyra TaxID=48 RepID=A0A2W5UP06_9BACT|nr:MAG: transporter [Archangium gephyra]